MSLEMSGVKVNGLVLKIGVYWNIGFVAFGGIGCELELNVELLMNVHVFGFNELFEGVFVKFYFKKIIFNRIKFSKINLNFKNSNLKIKIPLK
jgi:hypothetical protein